MMIIASIALSLLTIVAGLFLLAKTNKDNLGKTYTFASYAVIVMGFLLIASSFCGICCKMMCHKGGNKMECHKGSCMGPGMGMGMEHKMMFIDKRDCEMQGPGMGMGCKKEMGCSKEGASCCKMGMEKSCCKKDGAASCPSKAEDGDGEKKEEVVIEKK